MDREGRVSIEPQFRYAAGARQGLALVWTESSQGIVDQSGRIVAELPAASTMFWAGDQLIWVEKDDGGKFALYDTQGTELIPPMYDQVASFSSGLALVRTGDWRFPGYLDNVRYRYIDQTGEIIIDPKSAKYASSFKEERAIVDEMVIDVTGKTILNLGRNRARRYSDGLLLVTNSRQPRHSSYYDRDGTLVLEVQWQAGDFSEGLAPFSIFETSLPRDENGQLPIRAGFMNGKGEEVIPAEFTSAEAFQDGLAKVTFPSVPPDENAQMGETLFGYIDRNGKVVIPPIYNDSKGFENGRCVVHLGGYLPLVDDARPDWVGGQWLLIDRKGRELAMIEFD